MESDRPAGEDVSALLLAWREGDARALEQLTSHIYGELRRLANHYMRNERAGHTLQATALVHEAYTRLVDYKRIQWQGRAHFFAIAAQLMRRILVDHARRRNVKRGVNYRHVPFEQAAAIGPRTIEDPDLVALDDAMNRLARLDPRKVQIVEMRYFAGLSVEETAEVLKISTVTVKRDWRAARTWLFRELTGGANDDPRGMAAH